MFKKHHTFILHGLGGSSRENWFPWLKEELTKHDLPVTVPDFPEPQSPVFKKWSQVLDQYRHLIDETTTFVGHSLGCPFGLRYLCDGNLIIAKFVLVAPPYTDLGWPNLAEMMSEFPPTHARHCARQFELFASDDDPYVPLSHIKQYENLLGIGSVILQHREHLWQQTFPELLSSLLPNSHI